MRGPGTGGLGKGASLYLVALRLLDESDKRFAGRVLRKEDIPMGEFLVNVLAMIVAGVVVALVTRYFR